MTIDEVIISLKDCSNETDKQIAEWLEELKDYRTLDKTNFSDGYNKAIDDFVKEVKNLIVDLSVIRFKDIDEIAEQLKAGVLDD